MRRTVAVVVLVSAGTLASRPGRAQSKDESRSSAAFSDALFNEGKALLEAGNVASACERFAQSKELEPAVGVSLYLADCYQRIGRTASAWTEFRSAEALARERHDKRADLAQRRAQALAPGLNRITIRVAPALANTPLEILRDGKTVATDELGQAVPVDPGDHVITARSGGLSRDFETHVDASVPTASVVIDQLSGQKPAAAPIETSMTPAAPPAPPESEAPAASDSDPVRVGVAIGLLGAAVVGLGVGLGFGLAAKSDRDDSNAGPCNASDQCNAKGLSLRQDAIREALASTIGFSVGAVALGACAVVTFAIPHGGGSKGTGVVVTPALMAGGGGALIRTNF
jgi:hypothetical protein